MILALIALLQVAVAEAPPQTVAEDSIPIVTLGQALQAAFRIRWKATIRISHKAQ